MFSINDLHQQATRQFTYDKSGSGSVILPPAMSAKDIADEQPASVKSLANAVRWFDLVVRHTQIAITLFVPALFSIDLFLGVPTGLALHVRLFVSFLLSFTVLPMFMMCFCTVRSLLQKRREDQL